MAEGPRNYFALISEVAEKKMEISGQDKENMAARAVYINDVRQVQIWTLEWLAESLPQGHEFRDMFQQLADGVRMEPEMDLIMGEPGASGMDHG